MTSADGTVIEMWSNDAEGPTVLLCNGLGTNPYAWPDLLEPDCGLHVISWNHRGVGRSARPEDEQRVGMDAFVEDAVAVLDAAGVDRCVVVGWSIGVNTAFELAVHHPERVSGPLRGRRRPGPDLRLDGRPLLIRVRCASRSGSAWPGCLELSRPGPDPRWPSGSRWDRSRPPCCDTAASCCPSAKSAGRDDGRCGSS